MKRGEAKSKGEKERYKHLNAEFQRIARRDKKAFLSHQCKEIEENNRMGKTRDLVKKMRDTKGTLAPPLRLRLEFPRETASSEVRGEGREPLADKAGESTLLSRSGGEKGLR